MAEHAKTEHATVPKWMKEHALKCKLAFGLWDYDLTLVCPPQIEEPKKDGRRTVGQADTDWQYMQATVQLVIDLPDDEGGHKVVTHEFLHVALADIDHAWTLIEPLLKKRYRKYAEAVWSMAKERNIEKLAVALTPLLMSSKPSDGE